MHMHVCMHTCTQARTHTYTQLTALRAGGRTRGYTHSETHTGGGCGRWNLSHQDQSCGWCFCPDFRGSVLHFEQGNIHRMAQTNLPAEGPVVWAPFLLWPLPQAFCPPGPNPALCHLDFFLRPSAPPAGGAGQPGALKSEQAPDDIIGQGGLLWLLEGV